MFIEFGQTQQEGILATLGGVISDLKWLIIILIAIPIALTIIRFLIDLFYSELEKKKKERFLEKLESGFITWLKKEEYIEKYKIATEPQKRKFFKQYAESLLKPEKEKEVIMLPKLHLIIPKTLFKKLGKKRI